MYTTISVSLGFFKTNASTNIFLVFLDDARLSFDRIVTEGKVPSRDVVKAGSFWFPGIVYCEFSEKPGPSKRSVRS